MARQSTEERRAGLIALGRRIFSTRPYDAISTDEIAQEAGISKGLLYHYFPGKREFYVATVTSLADELLAILPFDVAATDPAGILTTTRDTLQNFISFIQQNDALYRTLLRGGIGMDPEVHRIVERVRRTVLERIRRLLGRAPEPLTDLRLYGWLGFVEHTSLEWLEGRMPVAGENPAHPAAGVLTPEALQQMWVSELFHHMQHGQPPPA